MEPALAGHLLAWYRDAFRQAYRLTSAVVALPFQLALAALLLAVTDIDAVRDLANVLRECAEVGLEALSLQRVLPLRYLVAGFTHATTGVLAAGDAAPASSTLPHPPPCSMQLSLDHLLSSHLVRSVLPPRAPLLVVARPGPLAARG